MKSRLTVLLILMLVAITSGCGTPTVDHIAIRDAYEAAIEAGDLDEALALFADDALIVAPIGYWRGKEKIREYLELELDVFLQGVPFGERLNVEETEDTLNFDERFPSPDGTIAQLHHAYIFENDRIKKWNISDFHTVE